MIRAIVTGILSAVLGMTAFSSCMQTSSCEEDVYSKIKLIGGIVTTTEIESKEESRAVNKWIVFQRVDCKKCISAVKTDNDGIYEIGLAAGKYQIFVRDCGKNKNEDCLAPEQSRFVEVKHNDIGFQFDIKLVHRKEDNMIELPKGIVSSPTE